MTGGLGTAICAVGSVTAATTGDSSICGAGFDVLFCLVVFKVVNCEDDDAFDGFAKILFDDDEDDDDSVAFVCLLLGFFMIKTIWNQFVNERDYLSTN